MLWLVPFQDIRLPVALPVDAKLDRFVLGGIGALWLAAFLAGGRGSPRLRPTALHLAVLAFATAAMTGFLVNLPVLVNVGDFTLGMKKLALLAAYVAFFFIAATSVRRSEIGAFCTLTVVLASVTALGIIWEYRTNTNLFYQFTGQLLPPGFSLLSETGDSKFGRPAVTGPAQHGLAATTMLALALPFAAVRIFGDQGRNKRILYAAATAIILAGTVSTLRKTAMIMPIAALAVFLVYRPRQLVRMAPAGVALILVTQALSPGALGSIRGQLSPDRLSGSSSTQGRMEDYTAVLPDVKNHLAFGRGYGTFDSHKYRLLDNQYLGLLVEIGVLGLAAYVAMILAVFVAVHRAVKSSDPSRGPPALAAAAAAGAFLVCNALFDVLAYPQVPYLFLFIAAIAAGVGGDTGRRAPGETAPGGSRRSARLRRGTLTPVG